MSSFFDFNNSGGFDLGDITSGLNKVGSFMDSSAGKGLQTVAGLGLGAYNLYQNNKINDYNKMLSDRQIATQDFNNNSMADGFSTVFTPQKKKKQLGSYNLEG